LVALVGLMMATSAWARSRDGGTDPRDHTEDKACLECHGEKDSEAYLEDDATLSTFVDAEVLARSVHADVDCTECHTDLKGQSDKHKATSFANLRAVTLHYSEQCKDCHFQNFTRSLDGVHAGLQAKGKTEAAVCVDCHGGHDIGKAGEPRSRISRTCAKCHEKISKVYVMSVHGSALQENENPDVPSCTDCHRAHDIADPRQNAWRLETPAMCGRCHTDEKRMKKYGLSTAVLSSYLQDFHGTSVALQKGTGDKPVTALCTDCHGIHDISKVDAPDSKVKANLAQTCRKCHPGSDSPDFPRAWLSHYQPTWERAPLVWVVQKAYSILIPVMIGSLILQIALHLWRVVANR
jgi:predicted CXXCH cytochrome family protein